MLDKTGTITEGKPTIAKVIKYIDEDFMSEVISIESFSSHPIVSAMMKYQKDNNVIIQNVGNYNFIEGKGVSGIVHNYYYSSGVIIGEFSDDAYYKCNHTGDVFFGGVNGFLKLNKDNDTSG